jgi:hypothetical protein
VPTFITSFRSSKRPLASSPHWQLLASIRLWLRLYESSAAFAERYAYGPTRVQFENKDPRGHAEFKAMLVEHSAVGSANTQLVVKERPSLYALVDEMKCLLVPTLIITGEVRRSCRPSLYAVRVSESQQLYLSIAT